MLQAKISKKIKSQEIKNFKFWNLKLHQMRKEILIFK